MTRNYNARFLDDGSWLQLSHICWPSLQCCLPPQHWQPTASGGWISWQENWCSPTWHGWSLPMPSTSIWHWRTRAWVSQACSAGISFAWEIIDQKTVWKEQEIEIIKHLNFSIVESSNKDAANHSALVNYIANAQANSCHDWQADEDPKLDDLYHKDDKRNPGEQGFFSSNPTTASMQVPSASSGRSRRSLVVYARSSSTRSLARPHKSVYQIQKPTLPLAVTKQALQRAAFA